MPIGDIQPPAVGIQEEPTACIKINKTWLAQIQAMIRPASFPEWWAGTLSENRFARQQVRQLMYVLGLEEECGDMAICCEPQIYLYRLNPETGRQEKSSDGGVTWTPSGSDPIYSTQQQPPIVRDDVDTTKCDAASNFSEHFNDIIVGSSENLGTAVTIVELAGGLAALLLDIFIIIVTEGAGAALVVSISGAIFTGITAAFVEGKAAFDAYWTADRKDQIFCAAYCTIGDNGAFSQTQWEDFKHKVRATLTPGAALDMVMTEVNAAGYVGANNMASYGAAGSGDCSDCHCDDTWCKTWDFTDDCYDDLWSSYQPTSNPSVFNTACTDGIGWQTTNGSPNYSIIKIAMNTSSLTRVTFTLDPLTDATAFLGILPSATGDQLVNYAVNDRFFDGTEPTGTYLAIGQRDRAVLTSVTLHGTGVNPWGADNCS